MIRVTPDSDPGSTVQADGKAFPVDKSLDLGFRRSDEKQGCGHIQVGKNMNRIKQPIVYILTNRPHGTLYIGVTSDLLQRIPQHKQHLVDGFSKRYGLDKLVYYELHEEMAEAIRREKRLKEWKRVWKIELIERMNPEWKDLYDDLL